MQIYEIKYNKKSRLLTLVTSIYLQYNDSATLKYISTNMYKLYSCFFTFFYKSHISACICTEFLLLNFDVPPKAVLVVQTTFKMHKSKKKIMF